MAESFDEGTVVKVPCCICGIPIEPNPSNMCLDCLRHKVNFTEEVPQTSSVIYCKNCGRYQTSPTQWVHADLESPELLQICLKKVTGLKDLKIVDSQFLFTEPHSRRIRVSLTLQKEALQGTVLRQTVIVTFVVNIVQCPQCVEAATPREHWIANVQLRQAAEHKRTLFWLEQQILKYRAHQGTTKIERVDDGVDFHFADKAAANRFIHFLQQHTPLKYIETMKQVGEDFQNGTQDMRFSYPARVPPVCRQDFVILPQYFVKKTGNQSHCAVVQRMTKIIRLVDPMTANVIDIDASTYWKNEFKPVCTANSLTKFNVINIEKCGPKVGRYQLADVELTDENYDERFMVRTHLGDQLYIGEPCLAYDTRSLVLPDNVMAVITKYDISPIIIVGRTHTKKSGVRKWHVKELAPHKSSDDDDFNNFMEDLEDDPELRQDVDIYENPAAKTAPADQVLDTTVQISELKVDENPDSKYAFTPDPYGLNE
jgi:nonsense-mediated mRNA decay protein 3